MLEWDITDHFAMFIEHKTTQNSDLPNLRKVINYDDLDNLLNDESIYESIIAEPNPETALGMLQNTISNAVINCTKNILQRSKICKLKPWMTDNLLRDIRVRDELRKQIKHLPRNHIKILRYNSLRNNIKRRIKQSKEMLCNSQTSNKHWKHKKTIQNNKFLSKLT